MDKKITFLILCIFCLISCEKEKQKVYYIVDNQLSENVIVDYACLDKSGWTYVQETVRSGQQEHLINAEAMGYVPPHASQEPANPCITFGKFCILKLNGDTIYSRPKSPENDEGHDAFFDLWKSDYKVGCRQTVVTWTLTLKKD